MVKEPLCVVVVAWPDVATGKITKNAKNNVPCLTNSFIAMPEYRPSVTPNNSEGQGGRFFLAWPYRRICTLSESDVVYQVKAKTAFPGGWL